MSQLLLYIETKKPHLIWWADENLNKINIICDSSPTITQEVSEVPRIHSTPENWYYCLCYSLPFVFATHCFHSSQYVFLSFFLFLSTPRSHTLLPCLEYKAVVRHEASALHLIPLFHYIQTPWWRLSCYKTHSVIWHSGANPSPLQLGFEKKSRKVENQGGDRRDGEKRKDKRGKREI